MKYLSFASLQCALLCAIALGADTSEPKAIIEFSKPIERPHFQGTVGYGGTERERPFLAKVTEEPVDHWAGLEMPPPDGVKETPEQAAAQKRQREENLAKTKAYTLANQSGKYVGWFGIVRGLSWNEKEHRTELLLEHKFHDGLSDPDILVVSIYGGGDFRAFIPEKADNLPMLSLIRVYGKASAEKNVPPVIAAEHVRVWDWGLFTFMDYGIDQTNPRWVALRKIAGHEVYTPKPTTQFYEQILGKREGTSKVGEK